MRKWTLVFFACLLLQNCIAQDWLWSKHIGGINTEAVGTNSICMDTNNDLYASGWYKSNPCYFDNDSVSSLNGSSDFFIEKLSSTGAKIWVRTYGSVNGSSQNEDISNMQFDASSNSIYFNGNYYGSFAFDTTLLTNAGQEDAFVVRMDLNGNIVWAKHISGSGKDQTTAMALDNNGNIFIEVHSTAGAFLDSEFISAGENIIKFDSSGAIQWHVNKFPANGSSLGYEAQFLRMKAFDNKLFAIGIATNDTLYSDTTISYLNFAIQQNIVACLDASNATTMWIRPCGSNTPQAMNIAVDSNGSSIITGSFTSMAIFESDTFHTPNLSELFLAKYDSIGNLIFAKQCTSSVGAYGISIALNGTDGFYLAGLIYGTVLFDSIIVSTTVGSELFVARYDSSGRCIGVRHLGEGDAATVLAIPYSDIYVIGRFYNSITFGTNPTLTSYGQSDIYIASSQAITGIQNPDRASNNQLMIFANPNNGTCRVTVPEALLHENKLTLRIYDITGKMIQEKQINMVDSSIGLNIESEAKGIYNITLSSNKATFVGKIIFE